MKNFRLTCSYALMLLMFAVFVVSCTKKNKQFTINGTVDQSLAVDSINLYDTIGKVLYSSPVKDGKFTLKGHADEVASSHIGNYNKNLIGTIILENEDYNVQFLPNEIKIEGGKIQQIVFSHLKDPEYQKLSKEYREQSAKAFNGIDMGNEEQVNKARAVMNKYYEPVTKFEDKHFQDVLKGDYPEIAKMHVFLLSNGRGFDEDQLKKEIAKYEKEFPKNPNLLQFKNTLLDYEKSFAQKKNVEVGKPFIEIVAKDKDGKEIKLSEIVAKNKFTILEFWASWCGPCRAEIPNLKKAYAKYKDKGLEIYSVSVDAKSKDWLQAMNEEKTIWPNGLLEGNFKDPQVIQYGIDGIPASFLISKEGIILASNYDLREFELDRTLSKYIK